MPMDRVEWALAGTQQLCEFSDLCFQWSAASMNIATFWLRMLPQQLKPGEQHRSLPLVKIKHLRDCRLHYPCADLDEAS